MSTETLRLTIEQIGRRLDELVGQEVELAGWLYAKRGSKKIHFLQVRDGTATLQCIMGKRDVDEETFARAGHLSQESSIIVRGIVQRDDRSKLGFELHAKSLELINAAEPYPISPKDHGVAFLMDHRHLWLRSARQHRIVRIRHTIIKAVRPFSLW